jgi:hypothetical protein
MPAGDKISMTEASQLDDFHSTGQEQGKSRKLHLQGAICAVCACRE